MVLHFTPYGLNRVVTPGQDMGMPVESVEPEEEDEDGVDIPSLSSKDISVLKTIRALNETIDVEELPEGVRTPATTTRIRERSGLNTAEVQHRLKRSEKLDDLLEVYPAPVYKNGKHGPKSAELTAKGEAVLDQITSGNPPTGVDIEELAVEFADLQERVAVIEASPTGALDEQEADNFETVKEMMVTFQNVFENELGINLEKHRPTK